MYCCHKWTGAAQSSLSCHAFVQPSGCWIVSHPTTYSTDKMLLLSHYFQASYIPRFYQFRPSHLRCTILCICTWLSPLKTNCYIANWTPKGMLPWLLQSWPLQATVHTLIYPTFLLHNMYPLARFPVGPHNSLHFVTFEWLFLSIVLSILKNKIKNKERTHLYITLE